MAPSQPSVHDYVSVEQNSKEASDFTSSETDDDVSESQPRNSSSLPHRILLTASLLLNLFGVFFLLFLYFRPSPTYSTGFSTDFPSVSPAISLKTSFAGGRINFNRTSHTVSLSPVPGPRLFAPPSPAVDAAWEDLMKHEFLMLDDSESDQLLRRLAEDPGSEVNPLEGDRDAARLAKDPRTHQYKLELGVYHSLHCLNRIRQAVYPSYYNTSKVEETELGIHDWAAVHQEHCFENLLHALQCHGDLTPVPVYRYPGMRVHIGVTMSHTCRDFGKIKEWVEARSVPSEDED